MPSKTAVVTLPTGAATMELAQTLQNSIPLHDRKKKLRTVKKCFVGDQCIDFLLAYGGQYCTTREQAVVLGRHLQKQLKLFKCVHPSSSSSGVWLVDSDKYLYKFTKKTLHSLTPVQLEKKMRAFQRGIANDLLQDRTSMMTTYKQCFVGKEAVDWMVAHKMVQTRKEAVLLARMFHSDFELFVHVSEPDHVFEDDAKYYRLLRPVTTTVSTISPTTSLLTKEEIRSVVSLWLVVDSLVALMLYAYWF